MTESLIGLITKAWNNHILFSMVLELTNRCDLNCVFCYTNHSKKGKRLTKEKYFSLIDQGRDLGTIYLTLTGGEPTLHKDFFAIGSYAARKGYCLRIKTHGSFGDVNLIERIKQEINPMWIDLSFHGSTAEIYEKTTQVKGSFQRFMTNLDKFTTTGARLQLLCPLTRLNFHQVKEMIDLSKQFNLPIRFDPQITPRDNGNRSSQIYALNFDELVQHYQTLMDYDPAMQKFTQEIDSPDFESTDTIRAKIISKYRCGAGVGSLTIDPFGYALPCVAWRDQIGNLWHNSLHQIWMSSSKLQKIRMQNETAENFFQENHERIGPVLFCPGRALTELGTVTELYDDIDRQNHAQIKSGFLKKNKKNA
ncbi:radical SAM protein [bacterium]|nr:radical SAM protein [bacterium]